MLECLEAALHWAAFYLHLQIQSMSSAMIDTTRRKAVMAPSLGLRRDGQSSRPTSSDTAKKDMWSSMLDSVASGRKLPEKNIFVLGS